MGRGELFDREWILIGGRKQEMGGGNRKEAGWGVVLAYSFKIKSVFFIKNV